MTALLAQQTSAEADLLLLPFFMMIFIPMMIFVVVVTVVSVAASWAVYEKAGQPGWHAIIPILNYYTLLRIVRRPTWWLALMFVPLVNVGVGIVVTLDLAKAFGKDAGFAVGMILLPIVFVPMLAWGSATYDGNRLWPGDGGFGGYEAPFSFAGPAQGQWGYPQSYYSPSPGWYPDPSGAGGHRWWDGQTWTDHNAD